MGLRIVGLTSTVPSTLPTPSLLLNVPLANIGILCFVLYVMQLASINGGTIVAHEVEIQFPTLYTAKTSNRL